MKQRAASPASRGAILGAFESVLVQSLRDLPLPLPDDLLARRRALRRQRRAPGTTGRHHERATLDTRLREAVDRGITQRRKDLEHSALDRQVWAWLAPELRALLGAGTDLRPLRSFAEEGFGVWWLTRGRGFRAPGNHEHEARRRALTRLQTAGLSPNDLSRFLALAHAARWPLLTAFAEFVEEQVRRARRRGAAGRLRAIASRLRRVPGYVSGRLQDQVDIEAERMRLAQRLLASMGPRAAPVKNTTRSAAVVELVTLLTARGLPTREACRAVGDVLGEAPGTVRSLYYQHKPRP